MIHGTDSKSLNNEESLPETIATVVRPIMVVAAAAPLSPTIVELNPSAASALKECLTHLEKGQVRIKGLL